MIRKVGNGARPWRSRLYIDGRDTVRSFPTKKLAEEYERKVQDSRAREAAGLPPDAGPITYDALCSLYLDNYTEDSKPWLTAMLSYTREAFGPAFVRHMRAEKIGAWLHGDLGLAPKTRQHILTAMRQVLNAGIEWGYLERSPARAVRPPKGASKPPEVYPLESWAEVLAVAEQCERPYDQLIRFVCATGLRYGEWAALQWDDIDTKARVLNIRRTTKGTTGKTPGALRPVALSRPALRALSELPRPIDSSALVFTTPRGKQIDNSNFAKHVWKPALAVVGLRPRPQYQMRHTYATLALGQGATLEWVSKQMGHSNLDITRKFYARFTKAVDERMLSFLDQMEAELGTESATK